MGRQRKGRRGLGSAGDSQAKKILARSLYNEFAKSGWSRSDILEYVNIFLDLVITTETGASPQPIIDTETGFVTRQGFQDLLLHELDPTVERKFPPCLLLFKVPEDKDVIIAAEVLRNELRLGDVVAPLRNQLVAVLLHVALDMAEQINLRLAHRVTTRLEAKAHSALRSLELGTELRPLWTGMLRELQTQATQS